jgi:hypothetical protein
VEESPKNPASVIESNESLKEKIEKLAEETYQEDPNKSFWEYECLKFSDIMYQKLVGMGINRKRIFRLWADTKSIEPGSKPHHFLQVGDYIIDGTWQQFLDKPRATGKCLILNTNTLISDLQVANVPQKLWFIYQNKAATRPGLRVK